MKAMILFKYESKPVLVAKKINARINQSKKLKK